MDIALTANFNRFLHFKQHLTDERDELGETKPKCNINSHVVVYYF